MISTYQEEKRNKKSEKNYPSADFPTSTKYPRIKSAYSSPTEQFKDSSKKKAKIKTEIPEVY